MFKPELPPISRTCISSRNLPEPDAFANFPGTDNWMLLVIIRRVLAGIIILGSTFAASKMMYSVLAGASMTVIKWLMWVVFTILFFWLAANFWISFIGFLILIFRRVKYNPSSRINGMKVALPEHATAVALPVYNENIKAVLARLRAMYESIRAENIQVDRYFDFFILSDSDDPAVFRKEEKCWLQLCADMGNCTNIFYRRRKVRQQKKHGNIMDFCRRWGSLYKYMIVLDSDSLMTGRMFIKLVKVMEVSPHIGILQSITRGIHQETPLAMAEQFANHLYGPQFIAGLHFLQLGDAAFWGHNAIVRLEPYMRCCCLPCFPGKPPFGGEILSHDFVEAAFMRRAGYEVWMAPDLHQSYEESPANLIEEIKRDRRWSVGNAQHLRFIFMNGITFGHRMLLVNGNLYYFSSALWFLLLVLATAAGIQEAVFGPVYFSAVRKNLFPDWPIEHRGLSLALLAITLVFLLGGKFLALVWITLFKRNTAAYGGLLRILISICVETLISVFMAPVKMMFHTYFIVKGLIFGQTIHWHTNRDGGDIGFRDAFIALREVGLGALIWGIIVFIYCPEIFWWMTLIFIPLLVAVPFTVWSGGVKYGKFFKRHKLLATPEELRPRQESKWFYEYQK